MNSAREALGRQFGKLGLEHYLLGQSCLLLETTLQGIKMLSARFAASAKDDALQRCLPSDGNFADKERFVESTFGKYLPFFRENIALTPHPGGWGSNGSSRAQARPIKSLGKFFSRNPL
jgi:hypothetical protein